MSSACHPQLLAPAIPRKHRAQPTTFPDKRVCRHLTLQPPWAPSCTWPLGLTRVGDSRGGVLPPLQSGTFSHRAAWATMLPKAPPINLLVQQSGEFLRGIVSLTCISVGLLQEDLQLTEWCSGSSVSLSRHKLQVCILPFLRLVVQREISLLAE